jgi:molybdopterin synthase catalytic subunit
MPPALRTLVQPEDFDVGAEIAQLTHGSAEAGAAASFVGIVRSNPAHPITALNLEHYPGMTEAAIARIAGQAAARFSLHSCTIIHRVGRLHPGERIVFAGAAAPHRQAALDAVSFLMDWLKTKAPFWKQEFLPDGESRWVQAAAADDDAAARWS